MNKVLVKLHRGAALQNLLKNLKRILFCKCISLVLQKKKKEKERKMGNNPIFGLELCAILKRKLKNNIRQIYGQFFGSCGLPWILSFICRGSLWLNISHC